MTLFAIIDPDGPYQLALDRWCGGEPDERTIALIDKTRAGGAATGS